MGGDTGGGNHLHLTPSHFFLIDKHPHPGSAEAEAVTQVLVSAYTDPEQFRRVETFNNAPNDFDFEEYLAFVKAP